MSTNTQVLLASRPTEWVEESNFRIVQSPMPKPGPGQFLAKIQWLSVDPYMRGRMNDVKSYVPPFELGEPMDGGAIGEVVESRADGFEAGDLVQHMSGWRDEAVVSARSASKLPDLGIQPEKFLGVLGVPGATAWFGLLEVAEAKPGDTIFVSAAAGSVGSAVVQIAKSKGMTVIGSAGGADKCQYVSSLRADQVIDYKFGPILASLSAAAANGIDVYFDNVGGDHLDAALATARNHARFAISGMIGGYNDPDPPSLRFIMRIIAARIRIQGFLVTDYLGRLGDFYQEIGPLVASGAITSRETIVDGLDAMPDAFLGLFEGANTGKMLVRL